MKNEKTILLTGATGLIGKELTLALLAKNYRLVIFGRRKEPEFRRDFTMPCEYFQWENPAASPPPTEGLSFDAAINLMGEPIAEKRWTDTQKQILRDSRILSTQNLVAGLNAHSPQLQTFISSSAIGYYGDGGDSSLNESTPASHDFLGKLCSDWEFEARKISCRNVLIRTGIVLSEKGGALARLVPLFENGLGGKLSTGSQWMSWIHITDLVNIYIESLENTKITGPLNAVSPAPVTNNEFTRALAHQIKVGSPLRVPKLALNVALGEMAQTLLGSQRVLPQTLTQAGYKFTFSKLEDALSNLYGWKESRHDRAFESNQWVPRPRGTVFEFFSNEKNLEILTPDFLYFQVVKKSTEQMTEGTEIEYQLRIHGIPIKWKSKITDWKPENQFKDFQISGPYKKWDHTHTFEELAGGTLIRDRVIYRLPLAGLGGNFALPLVTHDIKHIFDFRKKKIMELFGS